MHSQFNQNQQMQADDPMALGIPANLVFDDDPLEPLLGGTQPIAPTPASVVDIWRQGIDRSELCARALVSVLVQNQEAINQIGDLDSAEKCLRFAIQFKPTREDAQFAACLSALGRVLELKQQTGEAESLYRQALDLFERTPGAGHEAAWATGMRLLNLLEASSRKEEATLLRNQLQALSLADKEDDGNLWRLRSIARDMFLAGQYAEAESIYQRLVEKRFELGSAHCHLARLYLIADREQDARREVERAWDVRHVSPAYVLARIHCFKTLLQMLAGAEWQPCLVEVKNALAVPGAHECWTIQPVLDHLKPRLGQEWYDLMTALVAALEARSKLPELDSNPLWKAICGGEQPGSPAAGTASLSPDQPPPAAEVDSAPESDRSERFTFGLVIKVTGDCLTLQEYDFARDAEVQTDYHVTAATESGGAAALSEFSVGDHVVLDYVESDGRRLVAAIVKDHRNDLPDEPSAIPE